MDNKSMIKKMDLMSLVYASLIILRSKKSQTYSIQLSIEFIKEDLSCFVA
jgi:hypothetical protein